MTKWAAGQPGRANRERTVQRFIDKKEDAWVNLYDLTCEDMKDPLGIESPKPRLGWKLAAEPGERDQVQSAYQILVASSLQHLAHDQGDLWDSGEVTSAESVHVQYGGRALASGQDAYWKVRVWDGAGRPSPWSSPATFGVGILRAEDWVAAWIGHPAGRTEVDRPVPAPFFRRVVTVEKPVRQARVYVSGLGYYELTINGRKVGDEVLAPAVSRYDRTVLYQCHDITRLLSPGPNVFGAVLGNGWYNSFTTVVWNFQAAPWRDQPKLILQAHIKFDDGEEWVVASGPDWKTTVEGPIRFDGLRNGEDYDARRELTGWASPGYDDSDWVLAQRVTPPAGRLRAQLMPPIRITETLRPVTVREVAPGTWVFDLGQNLAGWARVRVQGAAGTEITLKYAERLRDDGRADMEHNAEFVQSGAFQTDRYILRGDAQEVWEPRFVYHGFRYVEVTGYYSTAPDLDSLHGRVVHTDFASAGEFVCSHPLLNCLQRAVRWSTLTNYHGIPTDCPHREKNGWTGDAHLSAEQVLFNFDPTPAYAKWLRDVQDVQRPDGALPGIVPTGDWGYNVGPAWDSALFLLPWYVYLYTGNAALLEQVYDNLRTYLAHVLAQGKNYLFDFGLGDWCPPYGAANGYACPNVVTSTGYVYVDARIAGYTAALLGRPQAAAYYRNLARKIREAFRATLYDPKTGSVRGDCQTAWACALYQGLLEPKAAERVFQRLVQDIMDKKLHLDTGILGTKYLLHVLSDYGRTDLAYALATQTTFPSWGYGLEQGATTLWERWSGEGSQNHHMFSDVSAWFYQVLAGIRPDLREPGFKHIIFRPQPVPGLDWVRAYHDSPFGRVASSWQVDGTELHLEVTVPVNGHATLYLPSGYTKDLTTEGAGIPEHAVVKESGTLRMALGSGTYRLTVNAEYASGA